MKCQICGGPHVKWEVDLYGMNGELVAPLVKLCDSCKCRYELIGGARNCRWHPGVEATKKEGRVRGKGTEPARLL